MEQRDTLNQNERELACAIVWQALLDYQADVLKLSLRNRTDEENEFCKQYFTKMKENYTIKSCRKAVAKGDTKTRQWMERKAQQGIMPATPEESQRFRQLNKTTIDKADRKEIKADMKKIENFVKTKWCYALCGIPADKLTQKLQQLKKRKTTLRERDAR